METIEKEKALDVVRQMVADGQVSQEVAEKYFPELKESNDERILKHLIGVVELYYGKTDEQEKKDCLAWLEKQGKKKAEVKYVYTKFQIGDVIVEIKPNGYCQPVRVKYIGEESYYCKSDDEKRFLSFPIISQDEYELVKQVSVWSEEDETMLNNLIYALANDRIGNDRDEYVSWLKSLKDRYTWKPSDEQMDALRYVTNFDYGGYKATLVSLYEQLKKLKG